MNRKKIKTSGFRAYNPTAIKKIAKEYTSKNFEFQIEILLMARKYNYTFI